MHKGNLEEKFHQCDEPENMKFKEVNHLSATSKHILSKKRKFCKTLSAKKMILTSAMLLSWKLIIKFSFTIRQQCIAVIVGIGKGQTAGTGSQEHSLCRTLRQ